MTSHTGVTVTENLSSVVTTTVAPEKMKISGRLNAKAGESVLLKCESSISNPQAIISWFTRGRLVTGGVSTSTISPKVYKYINKYIDG